jgi:hypothetical protein
VSQQPRCIPCDAVVFFERVGLDEIAFDVQPSPHGGYTRVDGRMRKITPRNAPHVLGDFPEALVGDALRYDAHEDTCKKSLRPEDMSKQRTRPDRPLRVRR